MRKAFSDALILAAQKNDKVIFLTGDLGFQVFDEYVNRFPLRYINVGVAEAQLVNAAVGLALEGWRPIIYSIASFVTARPFEQLKIGVGYHSLPVLVIGAGGGFTYSKAGITHHAPDDLALMGLLPNMTLVTPGGPDEIRELLPQLLELPNPAYLRVGKYGEPEIGHPSKIVIGRARKLLEGENIVIMTSGDIVADIYPKLREWDQKSRPGLYHFHTVKPIDEAALEEIDARYTCMIILEESVMQGGLYQQVCFWKARHNKRIKIIRRGARDNFEYGSPERHELRKRLGIDIDSLKKTIKDESAWE